MKKPIWEPSEERKQTALMTKFMGYVNEHYGKKLSTYDELYDWSVTEIADFWAAIWDYCDIRASKKYDTVITPAEKMMDTKWFEGARLNFAENMLRYRDDKLALIFKGEGQDTVRMTYAELYDQVARLAKSLRDLGVKAGDRVAGFVPNMMQTTIAMLAATSIGAVWSSCSPDFGLKGVLDRFGQTQPKVLFCANGYFYNGKAFDSIERVAGMLKEIPSIEKVVVIPYTEQKADISAIPNAVHFDDFLAKEKGLEIQFEQLPADHPLYIMYTSGTTGLPKCMVQSAAGILVNQMKEMVLHTDVSRDDTIFYFTTTGWMMWNWLMSGLTAGATLVLFDGSPFYPDATVLWKLAEEEGITVFGTSARYIAEVENRDVKPGKEFDLSSMKGLLSTGSPLSPQSYEFIYRDIKQDLCLSSISGGTDINGCFFVGNPILPVYVGELQCRGLGMKVEAYDDDGNSVKNQKGELVCTAPAPSMPIYFWNDPTQEKYHAAYYDVYPNIWAHGDYIEITDTGIVVYGRSDTTLNPQGVRIGTAEIYRQVETFEEIADSVVIGQDWDNDVRVVLFVRMAEGKVLDEDLEKRVKTAIRQNASPRHVPAKILPVIDIPYTISGKKVEKAVRNKVHGEPVPNVDALANPDSLKYYEDLEALKS